ncbi:MAG: phenylalanine--tRNA ligase subunit beta [Endomicrobium sp.]|jgi:phenylalanyl-tRNA synthetase beta chain|nr:phenylalanine--tRNA ligase subunit beta [Endomicrobium sp.]
MKFSYNFFKKFVNHNLNSNNLSEILISLGFEVSSINKVERSWSNVIVVRIISLKKHPNANKLLICKLTDGNTEYSVICGDQNIKLGQNVVLAKDGAVLCNSNVNIITIKKKQIRGVLSEGMICSEYELGIKKNKSTGVLILDKDTKLGIPLENIIKMNKDYIIDISIPTNRGDCLSYLGLAREIATKLHKLVNFPNIKSKKIATISNIVKLESNLCNKYMGIIISNVKVKPSPIWLIDALENIGIKSINNIVDITNYVMLETGQPLHAFDMDKFSSKEIFIRQAKNLEKIIAINNKKYILSKDILVIADIDKPISIAGIIGGKNSEIDNDTRTLFLESAIFDPISVRNSSKVLKIVTEASYRFSRGVDHKLSNFSAWRAANLIIEIAGGNISKKIIVNGLSPDLKKNLNIKLRFSRIQKILGCKITISEVFEILKYIGIIFKYNCEEDFVICRVPSWRKDINYEIDIIEEIIRIKGYDIIQDLEEKGIAISSVNNNSNSIFNKNNIIKEFRVKLKNFGFNEVLNYSFLKIEDLRKFNIEYCYKILNPVSRENEILRPSLLPSLYNNLILNLDYGYNRISLFEYGKIFNKKGERRYFSVIMYGDVWDNWWQWNKYKFKPKYNFFFGAGIIKNILNFSKDFNIEENNNPTNYYHPWKTSIVKYKDNYVGQFGILAPYITEKDNLKNEIFFFEIDVEYFFDINKKDKIKFFRKFSRFPFLRRDVSLIVDKSLKFSDIENIINKFMKSNDILKKYYLLSIFSNDLSIGYNKISYSIRLMYNSNEKTLTNYDVDKNMNLLLNKLKKSLNLKLRC